MRKIKISMSRRDENAEYTHQAPFIPCIVAVVLMVVSAAYSVGHDLAERDNERQRQSASAFVQIPMRSIPTWLAHMHENAEYMEGE